MTTKNNFKAQRKAVKKRKARQVANARANHINRSQGKAKKTHPKYSEEFINRYINEHGFARAVVDLKLQPTNTEFTKKDVMAMISESIPAIVRVHAGIEILQRLEQEGKFELNELQNALIDAYDETVTKFNEDVDAVIQLIEAGQEPEDFMELIQHLTEVLMQLMMEFREPIVEMLEAHGTELDEYAKEHRAEGTPMDEYMMTIHTQRMAVVFPIYKTHAGSAMSDDALLEAESATFDKPETEVADDSEVQPSDIQPA